MRRRIGSAPRPRGQCQRDPPAAEGCRAGATTGTPSLPSIPGPAAGAPGSAPCAFKGRRAGGLAAALFPDVTAACAAAAAAAALKLAFVIRRSPADTAAARKTRSRSAPERRDALAAPRGTARPRLPPQR